MLSAVLKIASIMLREVKSFATMLYDKLKVEFADITRRWQKIPQKSNQGKYIYSFFNSRDAW